MSRIKVNPQTVPLNPWMTKGLLISRQHKEKLFSKKLHNPNEYHSNNFKNYNKLYNKVRP